MCTSAAPTYDWLVAHTPFGQQIQRLRNLWWLGKREEAADIVDNDMILTFGLGYRDVDIKSRTRKYISSGITPVVDTHGIRKDGHEVEDILSIAEVAIGGEFDRYHSNQPVFTSQ